ncbi:ABC transporter permease [Tabrizicola soli]|uniref:ABC transporter permease n=1 Tax=Tabrizicola soli TaxID=2185115 RepID=A0ABV7DQY3_9RHOB|nr:ABC transporter permease [Tabrizicola soli]
MDYATLLQILDTTLRLATPLLFACLAGLFSERSGIFDIGLEGKMLAAAMASGAVAFLTGSAWLGMLAGIGASLVFAAIHGLASITFRGNQLISGVALNFLASGITVLVAQALFGQGGRTPPLSGAARFNPITLPFADTLQGVPVLGPLYREVISGHALPVYLALAMVPLSWWVLNRTRFGLRLRAVGENPAAVDTAGVSVVGLRYAALAITGILCGLAGAYMATALQAGFGREMTAGRGYIALAALIFAKWRPVAALWACLLFGFFQALALRPDVVQAVVQVKVPVPFLDALPYILTVVVLAGFIGKAIPPRAGGEPYVKER